MSDLATLTHHHTGIIVENIERYLEHSPYVLASDAVYDPIQKARLCLVRAPGEERATIELIEPTIADSPVWGALERGASYHHVSFHATSREEVDRLIDERRMLRVTDWLSAVLFQGRPVRFCYTRNRDLIEFVVG